MRIIRHIVLDSPENVAYYRGLGIKLDEGPLVSSFDISEEDDLWARVESSRDRWASPDPLTWPEFDETERKVAPWLNLSADWANGYPQPQDSWRESSFDLSGYCPACGVGAKQNAPFRMSKEPKWGKRWLAGLFWAPDALFVRRDVFESVFAPREVAGREVVLHRGGQPVADAIQLDPEREVEIETEKLDRTACRECGRLKFSVPSRDFFPRPIESIGAHAFRTREWFGTGASAHRPVVLSSEVYDALRAFERRQVRWHPCQTDEPA